VYPPRREERSDDAGLELGPLPGGHHGLSREQVLESQRERLLAAFVEVLARNGYRGTQITEIVSVASVSSKAFYESFDSKEACFLAAANAVLDHLRELVAAAVLPEETWPERVITALRTLLVFFDSEPDLGRICRVEPLTAMPAIAARFRDVVAECTPYLRAGRDERPGDAELPDSTEESLLGGLIVLASRSILAGREPLIDLLPDLVEFVLAPYLGGERAKDLARRHAV
jgi:AcrR family transcriptional regulator